MEYLRNTWTNITNKATDWWYYFFGVRGSEQLLLEYVLMDDDLSTRCVNTGRISKKESKINNDKTQKLYKDLFEDHEKNSKLGNSTQYTFLFESNE